MEPQNALTQTLYAQLKEEAVVFDSVVMSAGARGSAYSITKDDRIYWYWQVSTPSGLRKMLIGRDSEETHAAIAKMKSQKKEHAELLDGLKRASAAFIASGGTPNEPAHFRVMDKLAVAGLFRKGLILVGTHGFVSIGNAIGVKWGSHLKTTDMDLARSQTIAIAVPDDSGETLSVPNVAKSVDNSFFLVPELNSRHPSSTLVSRKTKVKLDFLTSRNPRDKPETKYFPDIDITATPLRYMDYLLSGQNFKGLIVGAYAIPVTLPEPARFAIHKLIIAQERSLERDIKAIKDIQQANEVIEALITLGKEHEVRDAVSAASKWSGAFSNIQKSLEAPNGVSVEVKNLIKPLAIKVRRSVPSPEEDTN